MQNNNNNWGWAILFFGFSLHSKHTLGMLDRLRCFYVQRTYRFDNVFYNFQDIFDYFKPHFPLKKKKSRHTMVH